MRYARALGVCSLALLSGPWALAQSTPTPAPVPPASAPLAPTPPPTPPSAAPASAPQAITVQQPSVAPPAAPQAVPVPATAAPATLQPAAPITKIGEVVEVRGREIIIDIGASDGLDIGDHVEIYRLETVDLGAGQTASRAIEGGTIGKVTLVTPLRAIVRVGTNEFAAAGQKVRWTEKPITASAFAPPRAGGYWEIEVALRPFLPLGTSGFGLFADSSIGHRFAEAPVRLRVRVAPIAIGAFREGSTVGAAAAIIPSYDGHYFELGLGAGIGSRHLWFGPSSAPPSDFVVSQVLRLGALDGVNAEITNMVALADDRFRYASTRVGGRAPLVDAMWMVIRGEGHVGGAGFGEIGLRFLVSGSGGPGSLFLTPLFGGAGVGASASRGVPGRGGPMIGLETEWRL